MSSSLSIPIANTSERRALFEAATLDYPSSDEDLLDPGHVDFVMYLSEVWKPLRFKERKAMPISKELALLVLVLGAWLLSLGLSAVGTGTLPWGNVLPFSESIRYGLVTVGGLLLLVVAGLFFRFVSEVLELIH